MTKIAGVILYEGPSLFDGSPIVAIATFKTENRKTGNLIQTWILCQDDNPFAMIHNGQDKAVCGACPLRGIMAPSVSNPDKIVNRERGCYVSVVSNGPTAVYKGYKRGLYPKFNQIEHSNLFENRVIRLGSYGEPVVVPYDVWNNIIQASENALGYTHQWKTCDPIWKNHLMASIHSESEFREANKMGWRTFRTIKENQPTLKNEFICPASQEKGNVRTCLTCQACDGGRNSKASVAIVAHGGKASIQYVRKISI